MPIRINLSDNGKRELIELLHKAAVSFTELRPQPGTITASISILDVAALAGALSPFAEVLVTWLHGRASRKVTVQTREGQFISIEGYPTSTVSKLLEKTVSLNIIQTEKD